MRHPLLAAAMLLTCSLSRPANVSAQSVPTLAPIPAPSPASDAPSDSVRRPPSPIVVPIGTHLPLVLRNGVNTRTAKPGDSVYFQTAYPIAVNNHIAIPFGSFVRGEILEAKRPGRIKGRGEFRIAITLITFSNGYTLDLRATPNSVDRDGREGVDSEGKIKGPSSVGRDAAVILTATGGGAYIGTLAGAVANGAPGRGALIGGGAAGLAALVAVLATRGPEAELPRGTTMDVVFDRPLLLDPSILPESDRFPDPLSAIPRPRHVPPPRNRGVLVHAHPSGRGSFCSSGTLFTPNAPRFFAMLGKFVIARRPESGTSC